MPQSQFQTPQNKDSRFTPEELLNAPKKAKNKIHPEPKNTEDTNDTPTHAARQLNF